MNSFTRPVLTQLAERRLRNARLRELRHSVRSYRRPAEIDDLLALLGETDGPDADDLRTILMQTRLSTIALRSAS